MIKAQKGIVSDSVVVDDEWVTGMPKNLAGVHAVAVYGFRDNLIDRVCFLR